MKNTALTFPLLAALWTSILAASPATLHAASPETVAYLGVAVAPVDDTLRDQLKLGRGVGLGIQKVVTDSPAAKAGVKAHDLLEKLNDQLLFNGEQLSGLVRSLPPGQKVTLGLIRQGNRQTLEATLGETELTTTRKSLIGEWSGPSDTLHLEDLIERSVADSTDARGSAKQPAFLGVELGRVEPALAAQLGLEPEAGALVNTVLDDSPAQKAGLKPHDVIAKLDGKGIRDAADFSKRIRDHQPGDKIALAVIRAGQPIEIEATLSGKAAPEPGRMRSLMDHFRMVPKVRVLRDSPNKGGMVIQFDSDGDGSNKRIERRVIVQTGEPGEAGSVHVVAPPEHKPGKTVRANRVMVIQTDAGVTTVKEEDGKRFVTVKGPDDKVIFEGPVNTEEEREQLPRDVREHLEKIEQTVAPEGDAGGEDVMRELRIAPAHIPPEVI